MLSGSRFLETVLGQRSVARRDQVGSYLIRHLYGVPFEDVSGRKGVFQRWTRAQPHITDRQRVCIEGWPPSSRPLRIAFLSDFHVGSHANDLERLRGIAAQVADWTPDMVLFGGDYVNMQLLGRGRVSPVATSRILAKIPARLGRFAILGNHDRVYGAEDIQRALRGEQIIVLGHEERQLVWEGGMLSVIGVPDCPSRTRPVKTALDRLQPHKPAIILAHDPAWFFQVPEGPFITFAGHTHGGQVRVPGLGVIYNASKAPLKWTRGLVREGSRTLYVTAGLGTSTIPLRVGVPPEIALIELSAPMADET